VSAALPQRLSVAFLTPRPTALRAFGSPASVRGKLLVGGAGTALVIALLSMAFRTGRAASVAEPRTANPTFLLHAEPIDHGSEPPKAVEPSSDPVTASEAETDSSASEPPRPPHDSNLDRPRLTKSMPATDAAVIIAKPSRSNSSATTVAARARQVPLSSSESELEPPADPLDRRK